MNLALKADIHIHTREDPEDLIYYSSFELIDMAAQEGFKVLSITNHNTLTYSEYLKDYARERGITLIPGIELTIKGRHVLVYNVDPQKIRRDSLESLEELKDTNTLIVAPHPFFPGTCALRGYFLKYIHIFDAVEVSHFYSKTVDFNRPAARLAKKAGLPLVGTSDAHQRLQFGHTYSNIYCEEDPVSVIEAIKKGKVDVVSKPLSIPTMAKIGLRMFWRNNVILKLRKNANAKKLLANE
ncbi:hypothetical protein DBT_0734 [Dissulfuribacter thermophilus]|uniref:Polymerase/histidinol phosphatase N-terminal domain-containing protein n=1 Tax=Dissulfuribacter thermophilus TaxID=1156395 RepID=A0A1B9F787_9BACT|nr:PHP domain-containing protein [Dissulfuribacter thermophilus]OCC15809.1 hypothetical protein DBT_0734 [Dissulfuribacter thermophilus]